MKKLIELDAASDIVRFECGKWVGLANTITKEFYALKPIDAVPVRHGRWVPKFNGNFKGGAYWYECSECGHTVPGGLQSGKIFCENCGADMRKDGDGNG